jgi:DNA-binding CsgD family transcriptional regulator
MRRGGGFIHGGIRRLQQTGIGKARGATIVALFAAGNTRNEIMAELGVSRKVLSSWLTRHGIHAKNHPKNERPFPVHASVAKARERLLKVFNSGIPFDPNEFGEARLQLSRLLRKHHPMEGRPPEQRVRNIIDKFLPFLDAAE